MCRKGIRGKFRVMHILKKKKFYKVKTDSKAHNERHTITRTKEMAMLMTNTAKNKGHTVT